MIHLVIFDCDGVLVDSERLAVRIDVEVLGRLGWTLTDEEVIEKFVGVSDADFRAAVEAQLGRRLADDWEEEFEPLYRSAFERHLRPVEGIVDALDRITLPTRAPAGYRRPALSRLLPLLPSADTPHG